MIRKPSRGVPLVSVIATSAAAMSLPTLAESRISSVRRLGLAMFSAVTSANSRSFDPK